jgi:probable HAF family extracellular repeat protein
MLSCQIDPPNRRVAKRRKSIALRVQPFACRDRDNNRQVDREMQPARPSSDSPQEVEGERNGTAAGTLRSTSRNAMDSAPRRLNHINRGNVPAATGVGAALPVISFSHLLQADAGGATSLLKVSGDLEILALIRARISFRERNLIMLMLRNVNVPLASGSALVLLCGIASVAAEGAVVRYRAVLLDPLDGGPIAQALAINSTGAVTGTAGSGLVNPGQHAVIWRGQAVENLDPMFTLSEGQAINDGGAIAGIGYFCPPQNGACTGVIARALPGGEFVPIGTLGGGNGQVLDINASGEFVGWAYDSDFVQRPFRYSEADGLQDLSPVPGFAGSGEAQAINDEGTIVGFMCNSAFDLRAFAWRDGVLTDLGTLGGPSSEAADINASGVIAGWASADDGLPHAFAIAQSSGGAMQDLQTLPQAFWSRAVVINDASMVGGTWHDGTSDRLFIHTPERGMQDIGVPVEDFQALDGPIDLNDQGRMVGVGITNMYQPLPWFWSAESGMRVLADVVVAGDAIAITGVGGINDAGQIAVTGSLPGTFTQRAARLDPVAPADIDASGAVNVDDLIAVILAWGSDDPVADIDGDGVVEVDDLVAVILAWS